MKEKEWFIVILKMYCITFCIITFLMTGWSWNAVGGERDKWLRNQPKDQLSTIKASLISTFLYVQYIFWRALTEAPCFVICLPLVAEGCIAWGGEGGTVGVFALDKTKLKVLLSSQSAIVKKSAKIWLGKLQAIIKWISWFKKVWSLNTIEQIGNSKKRWTQHLTFYIFICSLSACLGHRQLWGSVYLASLWVLQPGFKTSHLQMDRATATLWAKWHISHKMMNPPEMYNPLLITL